MILFLLMIFVYYANCDVEVIFLISGSDEFGGNVRQAYHNEISSVIERTVDQFIDYDSTENPKFGAAWMFPGGVWPFTVHSQTNAVVNLTADPVDFRTKLNHYMALSPASRLATEAGLEGSLEFLERRMFTQRTMKKVAIVLLHQEILRSEVGKVIQRKSFCRGFLLYFIVFPIHGENRCESNPELTKVVKWFNKRISWIDHLSNPIHRLSIAVVSDEFHYERAVPFCDGSSLEQFEKNILNNVSDYKGLPGVLCPKPMFTVTITKTHHTNIVNRHQTYRNSPGKKAEPKKTWPVILVWFMIITMGCALIGTIIKTVVCDKCMKKKSTTSAHMVAVVADPESHDHNLRSQREFHLHALDAIDQIEHKRSFNEV